MVAGRARFRVCMGLIVVIAAFAAVSLPAEATLQVADADGGYNQAAVTSVDKFSWIYEPGLHQIEGSSRTIRLGKSDRLLLGPEARAYDRLLNGATDEELEAVVEGRREPWTAYYIYTEIGYVTLDDWDDVDADELLAAIRASTETANAKRATVGIPAIRVLGWLAEPTLDRDKATVYWVTKLESEGSVFLNAAAVKLGRRGFEMIIWAVDPATYHANDRELARLANDMAFNQGERFVDYEDGDVLAGFGIASLVAISAGATVSESKGLLTAILAVVVAMAKKAWVAVLLGLAGASAVIRRLLSRYGRRSGGSPPPT